MLIKSQKPFDEHCFLSHSKRRVTSLSISDKCRRHITLLTPFDGFPFVKVMAHRIGVDNRMGRYPDLAINRNEGKTDEAKQKNNESVFFHAGYRLKSKPIQKAFKRTILGNCDKLILPQIGHMRRDNIRYRRFEFSF